MDGATVTKICSGCKRDLPTAEYGRVKYASGNYGLRPRCRGCIKLEIEAWRKRTKLSAHVVPEEKTCSGCGIRKPAAEFHRSRAAKSGLQSKCKVCTQTEQHARWRADHPEPPSRAERFWAKVDRREPDECWQWTGAMHIQGYGHVGQGELAHRVSWELTHGPIPEGTGYHGTCVLHKCDNRKCVNPNHLMLGTNYENVLDMMAKGRQHKGETTGGVKLSADKVRKIREMHSAGRSCNSMAPEFGVTASCIQGIVKRRLWRHI